MKYSSGTSVVVLVTALALALAAPASAHVTRSSGPFRVEMGWGEEPPLVSQANSVEVNVSDTSGGALAVPAGALSVEVAYGGTAVTLPLSPTEAPGNLRAALVPTRPGSYSFRVTGSVQGHSLDVSATCSETSFECVEEPAGEEFPVKDPSPGELARRLSAESQRAGRAEDQADSARRIAIVAIAVAVIALALAVRGRRRGGGP